jgi:hypothetical protein
MRKVSSISGYDVLPPFPIYDVVMENILRRKLKTK